jgi:hypothetical protein
VFCVFLQVLSRIPPGFLGDPRGCPRHYCLKNHSDLENRVTEVFLPEITELYVDMCISVFIR